MTCIKITRSGKKISGFVCDGHTGYGCEGEDIVCAAVSSIVQTSILGLMNVAGIEIALKRDDKKGFISVNLPSQLSDMQRRDADVILETMLIGLSDLYEQYSDFIELED